MLPMLAHKYQDYRKRMRYPYFMQRKYNGIRMMLRDQICMSRDQITWKPTVLRHITDDLANLDKNVILDGELYRHGWSLQQINSAVAVKRNEPTDKTREVKLVVFDCIFADAPMLSYEDRWNRLTFLLHNIAGPSIEMAPTEYATNELVGDAFFRQFISEGYEGAMYKKPDAPYGFVEQCGNQENRWDRIIKRKDWLFDDFEVLDIAEGDEGFTGMVGSLKFNSKNGLPFYAGSGLSMLERMEYWDNPPIGRWAEIKYETLSDEGIPLKPTIEKVYVK